MKVAVIGIGCIAQVHIPSLLHCGQEIVALCDCEREKCEKAVQKYGLEKSRIYTDYIRMLDEVKPESVHVCTPHYLHAEMVCACLKRNINVICEKPLAISLEQLGEIEKAVKESSATLGVCHQRRYEMVMQEMKRCLAGDEILTGNGNLCWSRNEAYYRSGEWRGTVAQEGGGVMINQALHTLDLLLWFMGMPSAVVANTANNTLQGVIEVEDTASAIFYFDDGKRFVINATNGCNYSFHVSLQFMSKTKNVAIVGETAIVNGEAQKIAGENPFYGKAEWGVGHAKLIDHFYECLVKGEKFPIDFYEGQKVVRLILAMYESKSKKVEVK